MKSLIDVHFSKRANVRRFRKREEGRGKDFALDNDDNDKNEDDVIVDGEGADATGFHVDENSSSRGGTRRAASC